MKLLHSEKRSKIKIHVKAEKKLKLLDLIKLQNTGK